MHSSKRVAQPHKHSTNQTINNKFRRGRNACPQCGHEKSWRAALCMKCTVANRRTLVTDRVFYIDGDPCRWIGLTRGQKVIVDAGKHKQLAKFPWFAQRCHGGFRAMYFDRTTKMSVYMSRVVLGMNNGKLEADHKNHNTLDERVRNLRPCTHQQNSYNRRYKNRNKYGYKGVFFTKWKKVRQYGAWLRANRERIYLGFFDTPLEAAMAYDKGARKYHGEFAFLNFPSNHPTQSPGS